MFVKYCALILFACYVASHQEAIKVTVYYESLCRHSKNFLTEQFYPTYQLLGDDYIEIDFLPFGKANHTLVDGEWQFSCQHGENECFGNRVQACVLNQQCNQTTKVEFVNCAMNAEDPADINLLAQCAEQFNINFNETHKCIDSNLGDELLFALGERTDAFNSNNSNVPFFVPSIVFNDEYNDSIENGSLEDFKSTICKQFKSKPVK